MDYILYLLCFLVSWIFVRYFISLLSRRQRNLPPGPTPLPIIGNLLSLGDKPHIALSRLAQTYGPVMCVQLGSMKTVVISSPSMAKEVMQKHDVSFSHRTVPDAVQAFNIDQLSVVFLPPHAAWRNLRKIVNLQIFSTKQLDASSGLRKKKVNDLLTQLDACSRKGMAVDIGEAAFNTTINLLSNTFFSVDLTDQQPGSPNGSGGAGFKELVWQIMVDVGTPNLSDYFPMLKWLDPQGIRRRMEVHLGKFFQLFDDIIDKRLEAASVGETVEGDALDALLKLTTQQDSGEGFNREYLRHMLLALFLAGTHTSSSSVEWAMTELLRNPTKMKKAQEELESIIGKENIMDEVYISKLPYLQAVIKETYRLHPPIPLLLPRKAMSNIELNGYTVPKDSQVLVNVWAMGKDPNLWKDASSFEPERFMDSKIDFKGLDFELTPFGAGRRICPGMPLSLRTFPVMLGSLIHSFDWKLEDKITINNRDMEEKFGITLQKAQPLMAIPIQKI